MLLTIYWTQFAQDKLTDIFEYYKFKASERVAQTLINGIIDSVDDLNKNPFIGQKEQYLNDRIQEYRYVIYKNYKIIYWIDTVNKKLLVAHVYDTRRNPEKIQL